MLTKIKEEVPRASPRQRPRGQLLKWVGNKFRYADLIVNQFPDTFDLYLEPFVGTGAVLATLQPRRALAGDMLGPLIDFHHRVQADPTGLLKHYAECREDILARGQIAYSEIKGRFNADPNPEDLLVVSRTCYGGVMRFTQDGRISTPLGPHKPMPVGKLERYMSEWRTRLMGVEFVKADYRETLSEAADGSVVYCDPPYLHGQSILYGAQRFEIAELWQSVTEAVGRGAKVVVSIDGWRQSGKKIINAHIPDGLFARELTVERGGCMLRRFQMDGQEMLREGVADRLLLSW